MPRLNATLEAPATRVEFVASPVLDLMNLMYFTSLVPQIEGVDGWPERLRGEMAPDLLAELDFLYNYPAGDPGLMGTLGDDLFAHPETWDGADSLLAYVRRLHPGVADAEGNRGIQGIIYETTFRYLDAPDRRPYEDMPPRQAIERRMRSLDDRDARTIMPVFDQPEELRRRMIRLIERFQDEHYRREMPKRMPALERSVAVHRSEPATDPAQLARHLTGKTSSCLEGICEGPFRKLIFTPSLDMGPYNSCAVAGDVHGLYYPCEPRFIGSDSDDEETVRLARIYKALGDEQRLRILRLLRDREMYAQEIVERTGLHQSVVSRHLSFMKAVGVLEARRQNNMKFYSLNPAAGAELKKTLDLFAPTRVAN